VKLKYGNPLVTNIDSTRPGDQYQPENIKNPFEERTINPFTAAQIVALQHRLTKQLGPEYISYRSGHGNSRVAYLEGTKAIALANDVFGFNGWSSSLQQVQVDYVRRPGKEPKLFVKSS
jgi:recombination DNA repair RAD52 pathway protein